MWLNDDEFLDDEAGFWDDDDLQAADHIEQGPDKDYPKFLNYKFIPMEKILDEAPGSFKSFILRGVNGHSEIPGVCAFLICNLLTNYETNVFFVGVSANNPNQIVRNMRRYAANGDFMGYGKSLVSNWQENDWIKGVESSISSWDDAIIDFLENPDNTSEIRKLPADIIKNEFKTVQDDYWLPEEDSQGILRIVADSSRNSTPYLLSVMESGNLLYKRDHKLIAEIADWQARHRAIDNGDLKVDDAGFDLDEELLDEKYSSEELHELIGKTFKQQKIQNIFRRKKYKTAELFAHTKCTECGREKRVLLSNLVNDPKKYGSCICADTSVDRRVNHATALYNNTKRLRSNTSGYTGVSYVKTYNGEPYDKWRAYIEVNGKRTYLGDFDDKNDAIEARRGAAENGVKWYRQNRNKMIKNVRMRTKKFSTSKYRDTDVGPTSSETIKKDNK